MTPEVKQRIEQIRQGIVPKGYKKTKTAIVPADWKESPIGKYIREYTEKTTIPNQYPVLTSARTGLMLQTDYYSNRQVTTEDNVGYNVLPYGYITFRSRSDDGRFRFNENRIIERGIISYFYPVFSFSKEVCHEYVLYLLNFSIYRRMYPYAEGTAQQVLSLKKLGQLKYSLPLVAEQKKIAEILAKQDKAIELQGRKIEELKRFKNGCLEKMFPRKGQKVPEKRFPGFTDDWEQRKLSEMCGTFEYGLNAAAKEFDGKNKYIRITDIDDASREFLLSDLSSPDICLDGMSKYLLSSGDIVFARTGASVGKTYIYRENDGIVYFAGFLIRAKVNQDNDAEFVFQSTLSPSYEKYIRITSQRSGQPGVNAQEYGEYDLFAPSKEEQQRIGHFLRGIDNLITLHQRKLEEMKRQKKALMQLLLTGIVRV